MKVKEAVEILNRMKEFESLPSEAEAWQTVKDIIRKYLKEHYNDCAKYFAVDKSYTDGLDEILKLLGEGK